MVPTDHARSTDSGQLREVHVLWAGRSARLVLPFIRLAPVPIPRYPRLVAQPFDILVRRGAARSHRVDALLDRLKESGAGPVQLRVLIQARLPRGQARPVRLEYQRLASTMIGCRIPEAADHARRTVLRALQSLNRVSLSQAVEPEKVDLRTVPWEDLLNELDRRGIAAVDFENVPDAILRREFGRRLRGKSATGVPPLASTGRQPPLRASEQGC